MAEETERIAILLQARDRDLQRALDRSNKMLARFERDAGRSATGAGRQVEAGLLRAGVAVRAFAGGIIGGVLAQSLAQLTGNLSTTVRGIASIGDEAKRSGLGVQAFQELAFVATQSRIPVEALIDGMKELSLRADEFVVTGGGSAAEAFKRLGFSAAELSRGLQEPQELMLDIVDRMEGLDRAAQIRIADEVFGGTGGERFVELLDQGDEGLRQLIARSHEVGAVLDESVIERAAELDRRFGELQATVSNLFKTWAVEGASWIGGLIEQLDVLGERIEALPDLPFIGDPNLQAAADGLSQAQAEAIAGDPGLIEENREAISRLSSELRNLQQVGADTASQLLNLIPALNDLGMADEAEEARSLAQQITALNARFTAGEVQSEAFTGQMAILAFAAQDAVAELSAIDQVGFEGVISRIGALIGAVGRAAMAANALRTALPGGSSAAVVSARRSSQEGRAGNVSVAPVPVSPGAPPSRPTAIDSAFFDAAFPIGAGGGGGGSSGPDPVEQFERLLETLDPLVRATNDFEEAQTTINAALAAGGISAEEAAHAYSLAEKEFKDATDGLTEAASAMQNAVSAGGTFIDNVLGDPQEWKKHALQALREFLMEQARMSLMASVTGAQSGDSLGTLLFRGLLGGFGAPSFDGGGYTGSGSRSGGIDGKGGFPAVLHPNETVIDHTKGGSGRQSVDVQVGVSVDNEGALRAYVISATTAAEQRAIVGATKAIPGAMARYQSDGRI